MQLVNFNYFCYYCEKKVILVCQIEIELCIYFTKAKFTENVNQHKITKRKCGNMCKHFYCLAFIISSEQPLSAIFPIFYMCRQLAIIIIFLHKICAINILDYYNKRMYEYCNCLMTRYYIS